MNGAARLARSVSAGNTCDLQNGELMLGQEAAAGGYYRGILIDDLCLLATRRMRFNTGKMK